MSRFPKARPTAGTKRVRPLKTVNTHVFLRSGQEDSQGEPICDGCGHLRSNRIHDLMVPDHAVEVADRIIGEG